jgi:hypothetical protein
MAKYKFKVMDGVHQDGPPGQTKDYKKGQVVNSDYELDKLFPNKFSRLGVRGEIEDDDDRPTRERKRAAKEPTPAAQAKARDDAMELASEEDEDVEPRLKGRKLIEDADDEDEEPKAGKRGQHAKAGQEGGSEDDEDVIPELEEEEDEEEPKKPVRKKRRLKKE